MNRDPNDKERATMQPYKPDGYTSVAPYLVVTDAAATMRFLERALGAETLQIHRGSGDRISHAEMRIDDTVLMLGDSAEGWPPVAAHVHVYVADVDATYRRALAEGAVSVQAPARKQDEDKRGAVKDAGGTTWWISTRVG